MAIANKVEFAFGLLVPALWQRAVRSDVRQISGSTLQCRSHLMAQVYIAPPPLMPAGAAPWIIRGASSWKQ